MNDPKYTVTNRGFKHMEPIPLTDSDGTDMVRVYESSLATKPAIWLHLDIDHSQHVNPTVSLTAEEAWQLKSQIEWLLEHHYQGDARPDEAKR